MQALAAYTGFSNSNIGSATYIIQASTPIFSPVAGSYGTAQTVTIGDTTPSTTIYYTTDGSTPATGSAVYSTPISVSANETLEALATAPGINNSTVATAAYSIGGPAGTPIFSLAAGTYVGTQTISLSDTSIGATIYYTVTAGTTGTAPTTASTVYAGSPISVSVTSVLEAIATGGGYTVSPTASAAYTILIPTASPATYVQQCNKYTPGGGDAQAASCTLSGVTAGDTLVIGAWTSAASFSSVTSTAGTPVSVFANYAGNNGDEAVYLLPNAPSGSITITASNTGHYTPIWVSVTEYTNVTASPLDADIDASTGNSNYGATEISTGNFTTSAQYDMLWNLCVGAGGQTFTVGAAPVTWTQLLNTNPGVVFFEEDGLANTPGTYYGQCDKTSSGYGRTY